MTRDLLAEQAKERGISLSAMLTRLARRETREAIFKAEREATMLDREDRGASDEAEEWEATVGDGID